MMTLNHGEGDRLTGTEMQGLDKLGVKSKKKIREPIIYITSSIVFYMISTCPTQLVDTVFRCVASLRRVFFNSLFV